MYELVGISTADGARGIRIRNLDQPLGSYEKIRVPSRGWSKIKTDQPLCYP
eukprot:SAG31_NODE_46137_length_255_cov_2.000000_1_plen_50_part_10